MLGFKEFTGQQPVVMVLEDAHWDRPDLARAAQPHLRACPRPAGAADCDLRPEFQPPWTGQPQVTSTGNAFVAGDLFDQSGPIAGPGD